MSDSHRAALADFFGIPPHGPLWARALPAGRYRVGCNQCGVTERVGDAAAARRFLAGHRVGMELVRAVTGDA